MVALFKYSLDIFKKVFLVIFVFSLIVGIFSYFIQKDKPRSSYDSIAESRKDIYRKLNNPEAKKTFQGKMALGVTRYMICVMTGEACTDNPADGDKNFNKSAFGVMSQLMAFPYMNPPASGVYWVKDSLQNAGFIPNTYAAEGIGFSSIKPLMNLWKVFRDVAYMLLVLFLVAIGFMIMFRVKINPQTVISVENTLPKIAVTMILITFSFAIAGFMIDLMYVLMAIGISLLSDNNYYYSTQEVQRSLLVAGPGKIFDSLMGNPLGYGWSHVLQFTPVGSGLSQMIPGFNTPLEFLMFFGKQFKEFMGPGISLLLEMVLGSVFAFFLAPKINENLEIKSLINGLNKWEIGTFSLGDGPKFFLPALNFLVISIGYILFSGLILPLLIGILFFFTIVYIWFRILFVLLTSYIQIVLLIIFSPFLIVIELIPGSKLGFGQWLKNLMGELVAFPVVTIMFLISHVLMITIQQSMTNPINTLTGSTLNTVGSWVGANPGSIPFSNNNPFFAPPFLFGIDPKAFGTIIAVGMSLVIPDLIKTVKEAIGAKGLGVNLGIGTFFAGAGAAVGGGMGMVSQYGSIALAFPQLRDKVNPFIDKLFGVKPKELADSLPPTGAQPPNTPLR